MNFDKRRTYKKSIIKKKMNTILSAPILIDTCVLLDDPMVIARVTKMQRKVFITNTILSELEYNKKGDDVINTNARIIMAELKAGFKPIAQLPNGDALKSEDRLTQFDFKGNPLFVLHRKQFEVNQNDEKIMEVASSYNFQVITRDNAFFVKAAASGLAVVYWNGAESEYEINLKLNNLDPTRTVPEPAQTLESTQADGEISFSQAYNNARAEREKRIRDETETNWVTSEPKTLSNLSFSDVGEITVELGKLLLNDLKKL